MFVLYSGSGGEQEGSFWSGRMLMQSFVTHPVKFCVMR